jgi:predicted Zn-dependent protease
MEKRHVAPLTPPDPFRHSRRDRVILSNAMDANHALSKALSARDRLGRLVAAALLGVCTTGCSVNPATGKSQLALITEAQEIEMGRQADRQTVAELGLYPDDALQQYVQKLGSSLAAKSERPQLSWQFRVADDSVVNAFALPGGYIFVTRGILAYLDSEAELVGVLGHEIGHVTARHSVEQLSRAELASAGLGVAMIASEDFRRFGALAQTGLGLLFLKFSRDDERQADDLGLRYLTRVGYDPTPMPNVFRTLGRVSAASGGDRLPTWLSTHPAPEDRYARLTQEIAALPPEARRGEVGRDAYLQRLNGLTFGPDPREGFFKDSVFYHPDLAFQIAFPAGWATANEKQAVGAVSPGKDAVVLLTTAEGRSPEEAMQAFFSRRNDIERGAAVGSRFYTFRTRPSGDAAQPQGQPVAGIVGFVAHGKTVLQLQGMARAEQWDGYRPVVLRSLESFGKLTDARYLAVQPRRLEVVRLPSAMSFEEFLSRYPSTVSAETVAIVNGVEAGARLPVGRLMKRVAGGNLP